VNRPEYCRERLPLRRAPRGLRPRRQWCGHCGRSLRLNRPAALVWGQGRLPYNLTLHQEMAFINHPPNCRRSSSEYLLRGNLTYLALARFRLKIALRSGGPARRVGRVDCNALWFGVGRYGKSVPLLSSAKCLSLRFSSALRPQREDLWSSAPSRFGRIRMFTVKRASVQADLDRSSTVGPGC
jgi:hypothetical protein